MGSFCRKSLESHSLRRDLELSLIHSCRRILAVLPERFELRERFLGIPGENGVRNGLRAERSGQSHGVEHRRGVYRFRRGALVEQRKAVAHAAVGKAAQKLRRVRREIDALLLRNIGEALGDRVAVEPPEAVRCV